MLRNHYEASLYIAYKKSEEQAFNERLDEARDKISKLATLLSLERTPVPDNFKNLPAEERAKILNAAKYKKYDVLAQLRQEAYFLELERKLAAGERLLAAEYLYFAMTTGQVDQVDPEVLLEAQKHFNNSSFSENISILYRYRKWQTVTDQKEKGQQFKALKHLLSERPMRDNSLQHLILNLHGANLQEADLRELNFDNTDFGEANFSKALVMNTKFHCSNLDRANFTEAESKQNIHPHHVGAPSFKSARARHAIFDGLKANNLDWGFGDFTGSSFKRVEITQARCDHAVFDDTDFSEGYIQFASDGSASNKCSFKRANFVTGRLHRADYRLINCDQTKFITDGAFVNSEILKDEIDRIERTGIGAIKEVKGSAAYQESQITSFQNIIATHVTEGISATSQTAEAKRDLVNIALERNFFQPDSQYKPAINSAYRSTLGLCSFFTDEYQHHEFFTTPAIHILQVARNRHNKDVVQHKEFKRM